MRKYSSLLVVLFSAVSLHAQTFANGQAARAVLGQTNFTAGNIYPSQTILGGVSGLAYANGTLWVADSNRAAASPNDSRVLGFPVSEIPGVHDNLSTLGLTNTDCPLCGFPASISLGQSTWTPPSGNTSGCPANDPAPTTTDTTTGITTTIPYACFYTSRTQNGMANATGVATDGRYFAVADTDNNRVLLWNEIPTSMDQNADVVLGQVDFTSFKTGNAQVTDAVSLRGPQGVWIQNNHLFVADTQNNRVLIWNTIPTQNDQAADIVLGQNNFTSNYQPSPSLTPPPVAANQLLGPVSVTADATHLYVSDLGNNRVLIWNEIPTSNAQNADIVVGQPDMTQSAANNPNVCTNFVVGPLLSQCETSLNFPRYALSINGQLFIADSGNDRVMIWNRIPTSNGAPATGVLGEPNFTQDVVSSASISIASTAIDNTGGVDLLPTPQALAWDGTNLYVSDPYNRRVVVFTPGDNILQPNSIVNWASELVRQEGIVQISFPTGITSTVAGDSVTVTIAGVSPGYTYTIAKGDTLDTIAEALVKLINADTTNNGPASTSPTAVTAIFDGTGTGTFYLSSNQSNLPYDDITLTAVPSNTSDLTVTPSGGYLSAGTAATGAIGMLVEINGTNLSDNTATATLDGVHQIPSKLGGVQVFMDGNPTPIYKVSPTQIVTQIPYPYLDRNSTSVYVRTVHSDGIVTATGAIPVYIAPANPGIFDAPSYAGQPRPWPIAQAYHQAGNPSTTVDIEGVPTLGNEAIITIAGTAYSYVVTAADVTAGTYTNLTQQLVNLINATDPNVTASVGAVFNRVILTAKKSGSAGNGITVTATSQTSSSNTAAASALLLTAYVGTTCCVVTPNSPIIPTNPAAPGETIQVTGAGLGLVTDPTNVAQGDLGTGDPYNGPVDNTTQSFVTATMGTTTAQTVNAFLPQGSYGTYIVDMIVPTTLSANSATTLNIAQNAFISNTVTIPVGSPVLYVAPPPAAPASPITEYFDHPASGSTISGTITAFGWAVNSQSALSAVNVSVDGVTLGAAGFNSRPDVCAAGLSSPVCPNVGWYYTFDSSQFTDGSHTLAITAISTDGTDYTLSEPIVISNNPGGSNDPFHGMIDLPASNYDYRGVNTFSGWFTYANSAIASVQVLVDGTPEGTASPYNRPDVCGIYAVPGCPAVGWYQQVDTTMLANGTHTLIARATSADGHHYAVSKTFQVQNFTSNSSTRANIDSPSAGAGAFSGTLAVFGWAGDLNVSVNSVGVTVDGVSYGNALYGVSRTDVCAAYALVNCPGVGFAASLDTTLLADGQHTVAIVVNLSGGQNQTFSRTFSVANRASTANPINGLIDSFGSTAVSGVFPAYGWAVSTAANDPITTVSVTVDGTSFGNATYGNPRPDVCQAYPNVAGCPNVGWSASLNSALLANGPHVLEITITSAAGHRASANKSFTVSNTTTGPAHLSIENPTTASIPFVGSVLFKGFAVNDNSAVTSVSVTIDGVPYGSANYGLSRPDVCATYPDAGCPNVGWSFGLDTTKLTDGTHTFGVTENNANGTYYSTSQAFTVSNYSGSNPVSIYIDSPTTLFGIYGSITMSGWATIPTTQIQSINIAIDGVPVGTAAYGNSRPDVCLVTTSPSCPNVGWTFVYDTQFQPNGTHTLDVTAITTTGQSSTVSEQFKIAN